LLFYFFSIFDIFYFYFTCLWFSKKLENFCVVLLYLSEILSKNWDIWNPKFQQNFIVYYFFFSFFAFVAFCISRTLTCPKIIEFFVVFYWKHWRFYWRFLENSKSSFKKILICEIFFVPNFVVYYLFFYFFIIFDILFSISSICSCQKILEIFIFLFYVLEILSKNFGKSWNVF